MPKQRSRGTPGPNPAPSPLVVPSVPRAELPVGCAVLVVSLLIYVRTLHPSVGGGDAGELMTVAHELGTPHPPGYPLFAMYTKLSEVVFQSLSNGQLGVGRSMNLGHAILSAFANFLLYMAVTRLTGLLSCGILASFLFGFSPAVWTYAVVTEVFALNNFFVCFLLLLCVLFYRAEVEEKHASSHRIVVSAAFVCGLASTNQHTVALYLLPFILWVLTLSARRLTVGRLLVYGVMYLMGISPYGYLIWSAAVVKSKQSWGDCITWKGLTTHVLRKEYGTFSLASKEARYKVNNFVIAFKIYFQDLRTQSLSFFWILGVVGMIAIVGITARRAFRRDRTLLGVLDVSFVFVGTYCFYLCFFHYLSNLPLDSALFIGVQQRFWIQPLSLATLFMAVGYKHLLQTVTKYLPTYSRVTSWVGLVAAVLVSVAQVQVHFTQQDESDNYIVRDFGRTILHGLRNNSVLLTKGDLMINSARFVQSCEGFRPDVRIMDQEMSTYYWYVDSLKHNFPDIVFPNKFYFPGKADGFSIREFLQANIKKRDIYLCHGWKEGDPTWEGRYTTRPWGIAAQVVPLSKPYTVKTLQRYINATRNVMLKDVQLPPPNHRFPDHAWENVVSNDYWNSWSNSAYYFLQEAESPTHKGSDVSRIAYQRAYEIYLYLYKTMPYDSAVVLRNFGVVLQQMLQRKPEKRLAELAASAFNRYVAVESKKETPPKDLEQVRQAATYYTSLVNQLSDEL